MKTGLIIRRCIRKRDEGAALITAMVILVAMTLLGFSLLTLSEIEFNIARNQRLAEQAVFAGEQGAMMGVRLADVNKLNLFVGDTLKTNSSIYSTVNLYPKWDLQIRKEGEAPGTGALFSIELTGEKMSFYLYRIWARGTSRDYIAKNVEVMIRLAQRTGAGGHHYRLY